MLGRKIRLHVHCSLTSVAAMTNSLADKLHNTTHGDRWRNNATKLTDQFLQVICLHTFAVEQKESMDGNARDPRPPRGHHRAESSRHPRGD